jgi:predicted secreted protein
MARHLDRNFCRGADMNRGNALNTRQAQPIKTSYTWKEIFGDLEGENSTFDQTCEINSVQFHAPAVAADEFESVYLWFLA